MAKALTSNKPTMIAPVQEWLRAEQMEQHVALFDGQDLTMGDLAAMDQQSRDVFLERLFKVPEPVRAQIAAKCTTLSQAIADEVADPQSAANRLEELIASTTMQIKELGDAGDEITNHSESVKAQIDKHFSALTNRILNVRWQIIQQLAKSDENKQEQIEHVRTRLTQQLDAARGALAQSKNGKLAEDELVAMVRQLLHNEVQMDAITTQSALEVNGDALEELVDNFMKLREESKEQQITGDEAQEAKSQDEKPDTSPASTSAVEIGYGHSADKSFRKHMEDTLVVAPELRIRSSRCTSGLVSLFAVFDGHGGAQCSAFCAEHVVETVIQALRCHDDGFKALQRAMSNLNERATKTTTDKSGSTACLVMIDHMTRDLWCCNVGDSRCILINRECTVVQQLSADHSASAPSERRRIEEGGGYVRRGRVCGKMEVSRAIGDKTAFVEHIEKEENKGRRISNPAVRRTWASLISAVPDITHNRLHENLYVVLASDGVFSNKFLSNEQCMKLIKQRVDAGRGDAQALADGLIQAALEMHRDPEVKASDNASAIVLRISV